MLSVVSTVGPGGLPVTASWPVTQVNRVMAKLEKFTVSATLQQAIDSHRAGKRPEAERAYQAILAATPDHPEANHNLGVLMVQTGRVDAGLAHLKVALRSNSREPSYWFSYARGHLAAG